MAFFLPGKSWVQADYICLFLERGMIHLIMSSRGFLLLFVLKKKKKSFHLVMKEIAVRILWEKPFFESSSGNVTAKSSKQHENYRQSDMHLLILPWPWCPPPKSQDNFIRNINRYSYAAWARSWFLVSEGCQENISECCVSTLETGPL